MWPEHKKPGGQGQGQWGAFREGLGLLVLRSRTLTQIPFVAVLGHVRSSWEEGRVSSTLPRPWTALSSLKSWSQKQDRDKQLCCDFQCRRDYKFVQHHLANFWEVHHDLAVCARSKFSYPSGRVRVLSTSSWCPPGPSFQAAPLCPSSFLYTVAGSSVVCLSFSQAFPPGCRKTCWVPFADSEALPQEQIKEKE